MVRRNIEPSINAVSAIIVALTAILLYLADRLRTDHPLAAR
jgi:ABC-type spermidine/putrescine transport system permease subunit II